MYILPFSIRYIIVSTTQTTIVVCTYVFIGDGRENELTKNSVANEFLRGV